MNKDLMIVSAAILMKNGHVLIARRKEGKHLSGLWEFPGGKVESDESPEHGLERELSEELGIETRTGRFFMENVFEYLGRDMIRLRAYFVEWISGEFQLNDHTEIAWVRPEELVDYDFAPADVAVVDKLLAW